MLAIGNSEPIPEGLPPELRKLISDQRNADGWCDHGERASDCNKSHCTCKTYGQEDGETTCWVHHDCSDGSCTHRE